MDYEKLVEMIGHIKAAITPDKEASDEMWGLYNYSTLFGVFLTKGEAIKYAKENILNRESWRTARSKGYLKVCRVIVTPKESSE